MTNNRLLFWLLLAGLLSALALAASIMATRSPVKLPAAPGQPPVQGHVSYYPDGTPIMNWTTINGMPVDPNSSQSINRAIRATTGPHTQD